MNGIKTTVCFFMVLLFLASPARGKDPDSLDINLAPLLEEYGLPALAAAVVKNGEITAAAKQAVIGLEGEGLQFA